MIRRLRCPPSVAVVSSCKRSHHEDKPATRIERKTPNISSNHNNKCVLSRLIDGVLHEKENDDEQEETLSHIEEGLEELQDLNRTNDWHLQELLYLRQHNMTLDQWING